MSKINTNGSHSGDIAEQYAVQQAEREKIRDQHEEEMDRLKKAYAEDQDHTRDRYEASLQDEQAKTYENLRTAKHNFSKIEKDFVRKGNDRIQNLSDEYHNQERMLTKDGEERVNEAVKKRAMIEEYQRNQAIQAQDLTRRDFSQNARQIVETHEHNLESLRQDKNRELEQRRTDHQTAVNQIRDHYEDRTHRVLGQHENESNLIEKKSEQQLNAKIQKTANHLSEIEQKTDDPFYRINKMESAFTDEGDFYLLKVKVPEFEKRGIKVQISGQNIQVTGSRNNNANTVIEPGHEVSTNSYQSYSERFRFDVPVDSKAMEKYEEDGWVHYTIPKYGPNHRMKNEYAPAKVALSDLSNNREHEFIKGLPTPTIRGERGSKTTG